jgi:hypothetical protein
MQQSFNYILQAAHMRKSHANEVSPLGRKSRSRTRGGNNESSFILNNITSLLSPTNLKQIEKNNLYKQQINSFYAPQGNNSISMNASAILNPVSQSSVNGDHIPPIQLKSHQLIKEQVRHTSNSRERAMSQTTYGETQKMMNPYSEMNLS